MDFLKNLFRPDKAFVPTPTQSVPGLEPIVVQAIENFFPSIDDQKLAITYVLDLKKKGRMFRNDPKLLLSLLSYSEGKIESLKSAASETHPHFWFEEIGPIFPKMKAAEEWVKSITKPQV